MDTTSPDFTVLIPISQKYLPSLPTVVTHLRSIHPPERFIIQVVVDGTEPGWESIEKQVQDLGCVPIISLCARNGNLHSRPWVEWFLTHCSTLSGWILKLDPDTLITKDYIREQLNSSVMSYHVQPYSGPEVMTGWESCGAGPQYWIRQEACLSVLPHMSEFDTYPVRWPSLFKTFNGFTYFPEDQAVHRLLFAYHPYKVDSDTLNIVPSLHRPHGYYPHLKRLGYMHCQCREGKGTQLEYLREGLQWMKLHGWC